jgi:general secretion pathway protein E
MASITFLDLLAQVPETGFHISIGKTVTMLVLLTIWLMFAQWMDKDAVLVNTWRVPWNLGMLAAGMAGMLVWLFVPMFWIGLAVYFVVVTVYVTAYIVHRNKLVTEETKVFTPTHIKQVISKPFGGGKEKLRNVQTRVALRDHEGGRVSLPDDQEGRNQYAATQDLLYDAIWRRASIVQLHPGKEQFKVVYEVDGLRVDRDPLPRHEADDVLLYLKKLGGLNLEERRKPQTARIRAQVGEEQSNVIEIQTGGSTAGEMLRLRLIGDEGSFKIDHLGFTDQQLETLRELMFTEKGVVIVTSPKKNGVTTSTYAIARSHDAFLNNIQTLERNKEFTLDNITQRVLPPNDETPFVQHFLKITRSDPDIIFVPDFADRETAAAACKAAIHKQRVYVAYHADDLLSALRMWQEMVNAPKLVADSLKCILNQRLVRKLCTACKTPYKPDPQMLRKANLPGDKHFFRPPEPEYDKHGNLIVCQNCHGSGYVGRTAIFDMLVVDDGLRTILRQGGSMDDIRAHLTSKGYGGLQQQALSKVLDGTTSIQEVIRVTRGNSGKKPAPAAAAKKQAVAAKKAT